MVQGLGYGWGLEVCVLGVKVLQTGRSPRMFCSPCGENCTNHHEPWFLGNHAAAVV